MPGNKAYTTLADTGGFPLEFSTLTAKSSGKAFIEPSLLRGFCGMIFSTMSSFVEPQYSNFWGDLSGNILTIEVKRITSIDLFILQLANLQKQNQIDFAIDIIYSKFNSLLRGQKIQECNDLMLSIKPNKISPQLAVTALMATISAKEILATRYSVVADYKKHMNQEMDAGEVEEIFGYLE